jgi:hypothetical protein
MELIILILLIIILILILLIITIIIGLGISRFSESAKQLTLTYPSSSTFYIK